MPDDDLMESLTMAGLEVGGSVPVAHQFSEIVVGEILSVEKHPNADKLRLCAVTDGVDTHKVVCGAPNVVSGMKAPLAKVGAKIFASEKEKPFEIKTATIRGVQSLSLIHI